MMRKQQVVLAGMGRSEMSTTVADFVRGHGNDIAFLHRILLVSTFRPHVVYIVYTFCLRVIVDLAWAVGIRRLRLWKTPVRQASAIENSQQKTGSKRWLQRVNGGYTLYLKNNKFPINATDKV